MNVERLSLPSDDLGDVLDIAGPDLARLRGARLFVTGGTGFFGRWITESWILAQRELGLGGELHLLSRDPEARVRALPALAESRGVVLHRGAQHTFDFPDGSFDVVIHAAVDHGVPTDTLLANVRGTERVLEFAAGANVQRFLFMSSGAVYGPHPTDLARMPETHGARFDPLNAGSAYGMAKGISEFLIMEATRCSGIGGVVARPFAFVGPGLPLDANYAIGNFIRDALGAGPIRVAGDGTPLRSYLYASDLAIWLWALLGRGAAGDVYNVGSPEALSIGDLARCVGAVLCPDRAVTVDGIPDPAKAPSRYVPDVTKAMVQLGVEIRVPLEDAIRRTAQWARRQGRTWA